MSSFPALWPTIPPIMSRDVDCLNATFAHEGGHALFHANLFVAGGEQGHFGAENVDHKKRQILCRESSTSALEPKGVAFQYAGGNTKRTMRSEGSLCRSPWSRLPLRHS